MEDEFTQTTGAYATSHQQPELVVVVEHADSAVAGVMLKYCGSRLRQLDPFT